MSSNKLTIIKDVFKNDETGGLTDGATIIIDGQIKQILDIIILNEGFKDYTEAIKEVVFSGINHFVEEYKSNS
ncbi:MAG TPA: hypothetical protein DCL31_18330 [Clostridium sp.]|nr:hypothetical protein [Clostridium sp.]